MTYRNLHSKLNKAIDNLSTSVGLEEAFYIQDDVKSLTEVLSQVDAKLKNQDKIIPLKDYTYKNKCLVLIDEANFYLAEASEFLNS